MLLNPFSRLFLPLMDSRCYPRPNLLQNMLSAVNNTSCFLASQKTQLPPAIDVVQGWLCNCPTSREAPSLTICQEASDPTAEPPKPKYFQAKHATENNENLLLSGLHDTEGYRSPDRTDNSKHLWINPSKPLAQNIIENSRFFVIKSYSEDDIHRSIKYGIWCSTNGGNRVLDAAFAERSGKGCVFLFFSVNGSLHFCGIARMMSRVDFKFRSAIWFQDHWKGKIEVEWIYVKDVPNNALRHIHLPNNYKRSITASRDTQEILLPEAKRFLQAFHEYKHNSCIIDDFEHYERRQNDQTRLRAVIAQSENPANKLTTYNNTLPLLSIRHNVPDKFRSSYPFGYNFIRDHHTRPDLLE